MAASVSHPASNPAALGMFAEAMQLISDRAASSEVQRAVGLLESALTLGYAPAGERLAAFHAMVANGAAGERHWEEAFNALQRAAEQGSVAAGKQLLLLADNLSEPVIPPKTTSNFWREVRPRIRLDRLLQSPARGALSNTPRIRTIEGLASLAECRWIIDTAREHLAPATVFDYVSGALVVDPVRNNSAVSLLYPQMDVVTEVLRHRISSATHVPVGAFEPTQILRY